MSINRHIGTKSETKIESPKDLVDEIKKTEDQLFEFFNQAFALKISNQKETDLQVEVFQDLWNNKLAIDYQQFASVIQLDTYYKSLNTQEKLNIHISDFLYAKQNTFYLSKNASDLLLSIVNMYHLLVRNKFILSQFQDNDSIISFKQHVFNFKQSVNTISFLNTQLSPITRIFPSLDSFNKNLSEKLIAKGYIKNTKSLDFPFNASDDFSREINLLLFDLPAINSLNQVIDNLKVSKENNQKTQIDGYTLQIKEAIEKVKNVKASFQRETDKFINEPQTLYIKLMSESSLLKNALINCFEKNSDFFRISNLIAQFKKETSWEKAITNVEINFKNYAQPTKGLWTARNNPSLSKTCLKKIFENLTVQKRKLLENYSNLLKEIDIFVGRFKLLHEQLDQFEKVCKQFDERLKKMKSLMRDSHDSMDRVEKTLETYLISHEEEPFSLYLKSFLKRHWGKILLSEVGTITPAISVGVFLGLTPGNIIGLSFLGFFLGTSAGFTSGVAEDHCCPKKSQEDQTPEEMILLSDELNSIASGGTFDNNEAISKITELEEIIVMGSTNNPAINSAGGWPSFWWGRTKQTEVSLEDKLVPKMT